MTNLSNTFVGDLTREQRKQIALAAIREELITREELAAAVADSLLAGASQFLTENADRRDPEQGPVSVEEVRDFAALHWQENCGAEDFGASVRDAIQANPVVIEQ